MYHYFSTKFPTTMMNSFNLASFHNNKAVQTVVFEWFRAQRLNIDSDGIFKLVSRSDKCITV